MGLLLLAIAPPLWDMCNQIADPAWREGDPHEVSHMATAWTQANIDQLRAAVASGGRTVGFGSRSVTYNSTEEMLALLASMEQAVNGVTTPRYRLAEFRKGV